MIPATITMFWGVQARAKNDENEYLQDDRNEFTIFHQHDIEDKTVSENIVEAIACATASHNVPSSYKSLEAAAMVLRMARKLDDRLNSPAMNIYFDLLLTLQNSRFQKVGFKNKKVIALEGFPGCGKSSLANKLVEVSGARSFISTPTFILEVKDKFSVLPEPVCRAFEHTINYFIAKEITECTENIVIIEQYYHAICANSACAVCGTIQEVEELPLSAFDWPLDLPQPSLVVYLLVSTEVRIRRMKRSRGTSATERSSGRIVAKDAKAQTAYSLVEGPPTVAIDGEGCLEEVLELCLQACESHSVPLRTIGSGPHSITVTAASTSTVPYSQVLDDSLYQTPEQSSYPESPVYGLNEDCHRRRYPHGRVSMGVYGNLDRLLF